MKFLRFNIILALLIASAHSLNAQVGGGLNLSSGNPGDDQTTMKFDSEEFDFGEIKQGDTVVHAFTFTNTGKVDLLISDVKPGCGCTTLDFPKEAIPPGASGVIKAAFDSHEKSGQQNKFVTVLYNGNPPAIRLSFSGNIITAE